MSVEPRAVADRLARRAVLPGALLLAGPSAPRLLEESIALAASLLCPGDDPDRSCGSCRRVREGIHPDLLVVQAEGVQIRIDRIREAIAFAAGRPYESARRVAIVSRADQLGAEAGNALLKSLEEPGARFHWILTSTRFESILPTILSRCAIVRVPPPSAAERDAVRRELGLSEQDAPDLDALSAVAEEQPTPERLEEYRSRRASMLEALEQGLCGGNLAALVLLAEAVGKGDVSDGRLLAQILGDAAASGAVPAERLRHRAVAGAIARIARAAPREAFSRAALAAVDAPPDNRRGNRRLHFESVLLELFLARDERGALARAPGNPPRD